MILNWLKLIVWLKGEHISKIKSQQKKNQRTKQTTKTKNKYAHIEMEWICCFVSHICIQVI